QLFKEPLQPVQRRSEIMISSPTTVKHFVNLFYRRTAQTQHADPPDTRLASPLSTAPPFVKTAAALKRAEL
ncbi:MAG: hypothetical protein KA219_03565, partial [Thauera sp.]|nr:hypothetical protein [Thauera sp.]MBP8923166.1 hypothetical protein [Thauera sp.]